MSKVLKGINILLSLCTSAIIFWYTAAIVYTIFVGPESLYWPKNGWDYSLVFVYGGLWAVEPSFVNKWKDKNPGRNLIHYLWDL